MIPLDPAFLGPPIAHRALHGPGRPENSLAAVTAAVSAGFGIEVDVQPSADAVAMVFHDHALKRLTGREGQITDRRAAELRQIPLKGGEAGITTLAEVAAAVAGRVALLVEIKDQHGAMGETDGRLEAAVAEALRGYRGPAAVMSFNPHTVAAMARLLPDLSRGLTTDAFRAVNWPDLPAGVRDRLRRIPDYDRVGASFISHGAKDLGSRRVADLKARGAAILCWTIRSARAEAAARRIAHNVTFEGYEPAGPRA